MIKTLKTMSKQDKERYTVPRKVQDVIPVRRIWQDGIFLTGNKFSKSYRFSDINYLVASREDKESMFLIYSELLNSLDSGAVTKITINNRRTNKANFENSILMPMQEDFRDEYRREYNQMLLDKATGANGITQEKYITISVVKKDIEEARAYFSRVGADLISHFAALGSKCVELDASERLRILHDFYRQGEETEFSFDLAAMAKRGHDFKDYICPDSMEKNSDYVKLGDKFCRVLFLKDFASYIKDNMVTELTDFNRNLMFSIDVVPVPTDEAVREVENRLLGVETNITNWQRRQNANNNFSAVVPYDMELQRKESKEFLDDLTTRDQRMMFAVITLAITADTKEQLDSDTEAVLSVARKHMCQLAVLKFQQLDGLNTALPIGARKINAFRTLTTESLAVFIPFKVQEIQDKGGIYFGENAISHNLIMSFLVPIQEEREIVLEIYRTFWENRSLLQTANLISAKYETKHGAKFTASTIRLILRNPIYCVADERSYNYFLEHDGNLFGDPAEFDGQHGLSAYNKTDQMKVEDEDSTFFNPKFSQLLSKKPISEWIVSVGRHEGFISSRKWIETQNILDEIAEKYNRPHRKTNALLSGLMYCPICGKRLRVLPESNRWTNGKPRFKYACPGVRAKECTFKGVEGVTLDEFVIHSLSSLQEEHSDYYRQLLENRVASMIRTDQSEKEYQETKKAIERLNADIAAQVRNLREADDALKRFIQDDIKVLTDDLAKREADLRRMENTQSENHYLIHELNGMKKRLLSFEEFAKDTQPETLFTLIHSIVERIYITTDGSAQKCQVYIKGCATEDYSDVLGAAGYIDGKFLIPIATYMPPMCDLEQYSIHTQIPQTDYLQADFSGYRSDYQNIMRPKRDRDHRSSGASGSYAQQSQNSHFG